MSHPDVRLKPHYEEAQVANSWRGRLDSFRKSSLSAVADLLSPLLRSRAELMGKIGTTFGGSRKLYSVFGWPLTPDYDWYKHLYDRGGIAKRVIDAYPYATWRNAPEIKEKKEQGAEDTQFEKDWKELCKRKRIFHYLQRVDRMARLGEFAILFIGYNDGAGYDDLAGPVGVVRGSTPWDKLLYLQPYSEKNAVVSTWDNDPNSPRFGLPQLYTINIQSPQLGGSIKSITRTVKVHYTRILHVAEDVFENDSEGTPALRPALNLLLDMEKVLGAAAEAFYQQTPPGTIFNAQADATHDTGTLLDTDMETLVDDFINGFRRHLIVKGMDIKTIQSELGDPSKLYGCLIELLAGITGIPKRILTGSEMGELASSQDETNWNSRIEERQLNWAEPFVLTPLVEEFIGKGVLAPPSNVNLSFTCEWRSQKALGEQAKAEVSDKKAGAIQKYCGAPDAQEIVPPDIFLEEVMNFPPETVERIKKTREEIWNKELEEMLKDEETLAEEEKKRRDILGEGPNRPPVQPVGVPDE